MKCCWQRRKKTIACCIIAYRKKGDRKKWGTRVVSGLKNVDSDL